MTSHEDAYPQMHAHWHGYPSGIPSHSSPAHLYSSPSPYYPQASNTVPYHHDLQPGPVLEGNQYRPPANGNRYNENTSPPTAEITSWIPYERSKRKPGIMYYNENDDRSKRESVRPGKSQREVEQSEPSYHTVPLLYGSHGPPHLPGAAEYLRRRGSQNGTVPNAIHSPANATRTSMLHAHNKEQTRSARPDRGRSDARPSKQSSTSVAPDGDSMLSHPPRSSQASPKRPTHASSVPYGTKHAPLEISSSPERETKRRKTSSTPQAARQIPHEASRPTGAKNYEGFSRLETKKLLSESTDIKPRKIRYYAVAIGRKTGVYRDWPSAEKQINGYHNAKHKKFKTEEEAMAYVDKYKHVIQRLSTMPPGRDMSALSMHGYEQYSLSMQASRPTSQRSFDSGYCFNDTCYEPVSHKPPSTQTRMLDLSQERVLLDDSPKPILDDEPRLVPEQQQVVDLIVQGHNVFYTGSAGCGKSTILKAFVRQLQQRGKRVKIVAPTNLAALNVGGQTTWNFAGWTPDSMKIRIDKLMENSRGKESWKKFDETDVLVIDEISMIENLQFERLNRILKASRGEKYGGGAFGGVQLVVTGDFYQLAPVKPFSRCMCGWELEKDSQNNPKEYKCTNRNCQEHTFYDIDKWAFRSRAWEECNFKHVNLTQIHRQSDMMFKSILNRIRTAGTILKPHANVLLNHTSETEGAIEIYARRFDVDRVNNENINKIPATARAYKCLDDFHWPEKHRDDQTLLRNTYRQPDGSLVALKEHRFETRVQLKEKQRVVLQANIDPAAGLVNGAQGTIIEFKPYDEKDLPKAPVTNKESGDLRGDHATYREALIKAFAEVNGKQPWPVVQFTNGVTRTIFADCTVNLLGNEEPYCKLSRTQIPLAAGYAITVHKSQGMTLDRVTVDLARAFEPSQIYVALSRARSLKGLTVTALPKFDLGGANAQVKEFMENVVIGKKPGLLGADSTGSN